MQSNFECAITSSQPLLQNKIALQGNIDLGVLFGFKEFIRARILDIVRKAGNQGHILNLGHGVLLNTPEENVAFFFETVKQSNYLLNNSN